MMWKRPAAYTILDEKATSEQLRELEEKLTKQSIELHEKLTSLDAKLTKKIDEQINSNYGLLDVVTERICFFCSQERYVYNMWRGFSAEGAQHQMKQHIRSHKEPAPQLMLLFKQWKLWTDELLGLLASKAGSIRHKEIPGWMMQAVNKTRKSYCG